MTRYKMAAGLLLALTACTPTMQDVNEVRTLSDVNCTTRPTCSYENSPLKVDLLHFHVSMTNLQLNHWMIIIL